MKLINIDKEEFQKIVRKLLPNIWNETKNSTCLKKKVGCVLFNTRFGKIMGVGSGSPEVPCLVCVRKELDWQQDGCWSIHSEPRALYDYFSKYGYTEKLNNTIAVVTHGPCDQCLKYLHKFGITKVFYDVEYHNDYSKWKGKIEVIKIERQDGDYEPNLS